MACIAVVTDLIFGTKITGTGKALGKPVTVARTVEKLTGVAREGDMVIVDLNASGVDVIEAIRVAKGVGAQVVAYLSHVQVELAAAARQAGADQVLARSAFVERLPGILGEAVAE